MTFIFNYSGRYILFEYDQDINSKIHKVLTVSGQLKSDFKEKVRKENTYFTNHCHYLPYCTEVKAGL